MGVLSTGSKHNRFLASIESRNVAGFERAMQNVDAKTGFTRAKTGILRNNVFLARPYRNVDEDNPLVLPNGKPSGTLPPKWMY